MTPFSDGRKYPSSDSELRHRCVQHARESRGRVLRFKRLFLDDNGCALADVARAQVFVDNEHSTAVDVRLCDLCAVKPPMLP